ncbi:MAG: hypothetical protein EZS28_037960 [Streblomastix strix]|uniref:Cyclin N-terminal domain-containing protein n=1 Tax=Streblomastix strix TaxID=222440 RepID=A0A5J4U8H9_9EUKA|nr:MAG: hypothetical protein EZS28_037960 [Streblomastix strix]
MSIFSELIDEPSQEFHNTTELPAIVQVAQVLPPSSVLFTAIYLQTIHDDLLQRASNHIAQGLYPLINPITEPLTKIYSFLKYVEETAQLDLTELMYIVYFVDRMIYEDFAAHQSGRDRIINGQNIGMLLVCAAMLATKMNRDKPMLNSWWAHAIQLPLSMINSFEIVFLDRLGFRMLLNADDYQILINALQATS